MLALRDEWMGEGEERKFVSPVDTDASSIFLSRDAAAVAWQSTSAQW
jgi:hypothetical protein